MLSSMCFIIYFWPIFRLPVWKISIQSSFNIELCTQLMLMENRGLLTKTKSMIWHYFLQASFSRNALSSGAHYSRKHFENEWVNILYHSVILVKYPLYCQEGCTALSVWLEDWQSWAKSSTIPVIFLLVLCKINKESFEWVQSWTEPASSLQLKSMHRENRWESPL